jgi:pimeloyl-ACP methyl ester carboxylesterase
MRSIVFLPGAGGRRGFWQPVANRLADCGPALCFAWPGFGDVAAEPEIGTLHDLYGWLLARLPDGEWNIVAQSMGGVLAARLAIEHPGRVRRLVLCATSGGLDVAALGGSNWRAEYLAELPGVPDWFVTDRTDLSARLPSITSPTLVLSSDVDPVSPLAVGQALTALIPRARLAVVSGGSHAFAHEEPDQVAQLIRAHIA